MGSTIHPSNSDDTLVLCAGPGRFLKVIGWWVRELKGGRVMFHPFYNRVLLVYGRNKSNKVNPIIVLRHKHLCCGISFCY